MLQPSVGGDDFVCRRLHEPGTVTTAAQRGRLHDMAPSPDEAPMQAEAGVQ